jgi:sphingosine kinase
VWETESEPLFREADIECEVLVTERAGHAKDECASRALAGLHGIVIVGGDGLIFEVVSGLSSREGGGRDVLACTPLIPIPGGSGNGLAKSITFQCGEDCSARTAAFIAIKGAATPLDVSRVTTSTHQFSSFLLFGWVSGE